MLKNILDTSRSLRWLKGLTVAAGLSLAACDVTHTLQVVSAGQTGCAPDDIQITDEEPGFSSHSWVAWCNGERYQCFGAGNTASCKAPPAKARELTESAPPRRTAVAAWAAHEVPGCGVSADFPSEPKAESSEVSTKTGPVKLSSLVFELPSGRGALSLSCAPALAKAGATATVVMLDGARDGMLKNIGATLSEEREIIGGREIQFELNGERGLAHLLWFNQRLVLAIAVPLRAVTPKAAKRFVDSVHAVDPG